MKIKYFITTIVFLAVAGFLPKTYAQETAKKDSGYVFTIDKQLKASSVKDQFSSGTCWSFAGCSFLESELLRMGKPEFNLSEMFCVRTAYGDKAIKYIRYHGDCSFGSGGEPHDMLNIIRKYGMVPDEVYSGLNYGEKKHIHGEMDEVLKDYLDGVVKNKNGKLTPVWYEGFNGLLDAYLGKYPEKFNFKGKEHTPQSFVKELGINPDDYVCLTSFTHHPYFSKFVIEIPDNWANESAYNLPLDQLVQVCDNAINNGYTVDWAADVSEKGFSWKNGVAIVPEADTLNMNQTEKDKWDKMSDSERNKQLYTFDKPGKEKVITPEIRQEAFDNYGTTDDHSIHITGIAHDQNGTKYYLVKNSWNVTGNPYKGYFYASESFLRYKTISIMVHKNAIPKDIAKKLGL